jgi:hypothetical protein
MTDESNCVSLTPEKTEKILSAPAAFAAKTKDGIRRQGDVPK